MDVLTDPIEELINRYRSEDKIIEIDQTVRDNEIKAINEEMADFGLKQRAYFNKSVESARKAYLTF